MKKKELILRSFFNGIASLINTNIFPQIGGGALTVFLIGAGKRSKESLREDIRKEMIDKKYGKWMDIYYPEDLFEELMKSSPDFDLLSLENLLARSVHAIVIVLESPGAIAELGAFSNHEQLRDKIVLLVDNRFRKVRSFIALGPVRFLKKTKSVVLYSDFKSKDLIDKMVLGMEIRSAVRKVSQGVVIDRKVNNPIAAQHFLLSTIYISEPIDKDVLLGMLESIIKEVSGDENNLKMGSVIFSSALNILLYHKDILLKEGKYSLTFSGYKKMKELLFFEKDRKNLEKQLDEYRVKVLNKTLRGSF